MTDLTVGITLKADGSGLVGEVKISREELERLKASAQGVGPAADRGAQGMQRMQREARGLNSTVVGLRGALGALGIAFGASQVINFGRDILDTTARMQTLETRIAAFVGRGPELAETMDFITRTAQEQSQEIFTVAEAYSKLLPLVDSGVISMGNARDILTGFNDVAARTGATSAQLGQAMFGLSQGLSAGVLRAEELNQVVEPLPGLLQALDRAAQLPAGGFRKLVVDGEVTSEMFRTTLIKALQEYEGAAAETAGNLEATWTRLGNSWDQLLINLGRPIAAPLAALIGDLARRTREPTIQERIDELRRPMFILPHAQREIDRLLELQRELQRGQFMSSIEVPGDLRARPAAGGDAGGGVPESYAKVTAAIEQQIQAEQRLAAARGQGNEALRQAMIANEAAALIAKAGVDACSHEADVLRGLAAQLVDLGLAEQAYTEEKRRRAEAAEAAMEAAEDEARAWEQLYAAGQKIEDGWRQMGEAITREVMTPLERFNEEMADLEFLLARGEISQETFNRAVKQAGDELAEASGDAEDFRQTMRDAGQAIGTAFEDAIVNGKSFREVLAGLEQDIVRIAARLAITKPLENAIGGIFDGIDFGDIWDSIFGGGSSPAPAGGSPMAGQRPWIFHSGGIVGRTPAPQRDVPPQLFSHAPRMHSGGPIGPGEVPIVAKQGEVIGWPDQLARAFGGGNMIVQIIDQRGGGGEIRTEETRGPNGERVLKAFVLDAVEQGFGAGRFDRVLGNGFGVTRRGATR